MICLPGAGREDSIRPVPAWRGTAHRAGPSGEGSGRARAGAGLEAGDCSSGEAPRGASPVERDGQQTVPTTRRAQEARRPEADRSSIRRLPRSRGTRRRPEPPPARRWRLLAGFSRMDPRHARVTGDCPLDEDGPSPCSGYCCLGSRRGWTLAMLGYW